MSASDYAAHMSTRHDFHSLLHRVELFSERSIADEIYIDEMRQTVEYADMMDRRSKLFFRQCQLSVAKIAAQVEAQLSFIQAKINEEIIKLEKKYTDVFSELHTISLSQSNAKNRKRSTLLQHRLVSMAIKMDRLHCEWEGHNKPSQQMLSSDTHEKLAMLQEDTTAFNDECIIYNKSHERQVAPLVVDANTFAPFVKKSRRTVYSDAPLIV